MPNQQTILPTGSNSTGQASVSTEGSAHIARGPAKGQLTTDRCVSCGNLIQDKDKMAARVFPGLGLRQTCSAACRETLPGLRLGPQSRLRIHVLFHRCMDA
jgi:hypothetical protein